MFETYDAWLQRPVSAVAVVDADDSYDDYLAAFRAESDRLFAEGGHDFTDPDAFYAAGDQPMTYEQFCLWQLDELDAYDDHLRQEAQEQFDDLYR